MLSIIIVFILALLSIPMILFAGEGGLNPGAVWEFLKSFPLDHPIASLGIAYLMQKGGPIVWFLLHVVKTVRDGLVDDTEAAGILWRLAAIVSGFWPNKSRKIILKYAPRHWHDVILKGKDLTFQLVAVPLGQVTEVLELLSGAKITVLRADTDKPSAPTVPEGG